jgi:hypothetical protein
MLDMSYLGAALAGILSFFTPCVLPMVPFYLDPPPLIWSAPIVRNWRIEDGNQTTQAGRDCHEVAAC